jgi:hypothetical protein
LEYALNGTFDLARSADYPTTVFIGPSYFESYNTWKDVKFCHGFNLGLGANRSSGWQTLLDTVPLACKALGGGKLQLWAYGNEPNLYPTSAQGPVRPPGWDESAYVSEWLNGTGQITALLEEHCPELADKERYGYMAPSFAGVDNRLKAHLSWTAGLDDDKNINLFSIHKYTPSTPCQKHPLTLPSYISGAETPGVTLQGTLMNHAVTKLSVDARRAEYDAVVSESPGPVPPLIFGETNSLYNQGRPGLSNTFGAALWGIDFNLYSASVGFKRVHMHMGTNYRVLSFRYVLCCLSVLTRDCVPSTAPGSPSQPTRPQWAPKPPTTAPSPWPRPWATARQPSWKSRSTLRFLARSSSPKRPTQSIPRVGLSTFIIPP